MSLTLTNSFKYIERDLGIKSFKLLKAFRKNNVEVLWNAYDSFRSHELGQIQDFLFSLQLFQSKRLGGWMGDWLAGKAIYIATKWLLYIGLSSRPSVALWQ